MEIRFSSAAPPRAACLLAAACRNAKGQCKNDATPFARVARQVDLRGEGWQAVGDYFPASPMKISPSRSLEHYNVPGISRTRRKCRPRSKKTAQVPRRPNEGSKVVAAPGPSSVARERYGAARFRARGAVPAGADDDCRLALLLFPGTHSCAHSAGKTCMCAGPSRLRQRARAGSVRVNRRGWRGCRRQAGRALRRRRCW